MGKFNLGKHIKDASFRERAIVITGQFRPGFTMKLKFVDKDSASQMLNDSMDQVFEKGKRDFQMNTDKYAKSLAAVILGWEGLRKEYISEMCMVPEDGLPDELPYSKESAETILLNDQSGLADFIVGHMRDTALAQDAELDEEKKT